MFVILLWDMRGKLCQRREEHQLIANVRFWYGTTTGQDIVKNWYFVHLATHSVLSCYRRKLKWYRTRVCGICAASSCTREYRSACGQLLVSRHSGRSTRNPYGMYVIVCFSAYRVLKTHEKSWNLSLDFSGPEKSWNWTEVLKKSWIWLVCSWKPSKWWNNFCSLISLHWWL